MPQNKELLSDITIKINGSNMPMDAMNDMIECAVENSLHLPDSCTIRMHDIKLRWIDEALFSVGNSIEVQMGFTGTLGVVFQGEITAVEMDLAAHSVPTLVVRGLNKGHRLHRGSKRRTFVKVKDSDIITQIAGEVGLTTKVAATNTQHEWVCQNNQTNWEFIQFLANRNGFRAYVEGKDKLVFQKVGDGNEVSQRMEWGKDLYSFRPRLSTAGQVDEVIVRGWDPKKKQSIVGKASNDNERPSVGYGKKGGEAASKAFSSASHAIVDHPVENQQHADTLAQSALDRRGTRFIEADGLCVGSFKIQAGKKVNVGKIGNRFTGDYFVTSCTHTYTPAEGYLTQFVCSGKNPNTLISLINPEKTDQPFSGGTIVVAIVTNNLDPEDQGRIKVKYPWLSEDHESDWARISTPMAGKDRGFMYLPEVDDEVLVAFEHGDIHRPYMIGALWNGKDSPVEGNSKAVVGGKVVQRVIKTRKGHIVMLDDTDDKELVRVTTQAGHKFTMDDGEKNIELKTKDGHYLLLDDKNKKMVLKDSSGNETMTVDVQTGNIEFECSGDFKVDAKKKIQMTAKMGIEISTPAKLSLEGSTEATVSSTGMMSLTTSGMAKLSASGVLTIQGSMVNIN